MGVRRIIVLAAIITCALMSYFYLANKYNPDIAELYCRENISYEDYKRLRESNKDVFFSMNYIAQYQGNKLIMTTGSDYMVKELELSKGSFLADNNMKEAVMGDMAAEKYFRNLNIIGKFINLFGEEYKVKGTIKGSKELYIPYSDKLKNITWQKKIIRCGINDKKHFYLKLDTLQNQLEASEVEILDVVSYREEMSTYKNIAVLAAAYILIYYFLFFIRKIYDRLIMLRKEYLENSRVFELHTYLLQKAGDIIAAAGICVIESAIAFAVYKLLSHLYIVPFIVPDNLFSPSSYISTFRLLFIRNLTRIENGVNGILADIKILNAAFTIIVLSIATISHKIYSFREKNKIMF